MQTTQPQTGFSIQFTTNTTSLTKVINVRNKNICLPQQTNEIPKMKIEEKIHSKTSLVTFIFSIFVMKLRPNLLIQIESELSGDY
jgi:hypothetical protein